MSDSIFYVSERAPFSGSTSLEIYDRGNGYRFVFTWVFEKCDEDWASRDRQIESEFSLSKEDALRYMRALKETGCAQIGSLQFEVFGNCFSVSNDIKNIYVMESNAANAKALFAYFGL